MEFLKQYLDDGIITMDEYYEIMNKSLSIVTNNRKIVVERIKKFDKGSRMHKLYGDLLISLNYAVRFTKQFLDFNNKEIVNYNIITLNNNIKIDEHATDIDLYIQLIYNLRFMLKIGHYATLHVIKDENIKNINPAFYKRLQKMDRFLYNSESCNMALFEKNEIESKVENILNLLDKEIINFRSSSNVQEAYKNV